MGKKRGPRGLGSGHYLRSEDVRRATGYAQTPRGQKFVARKRRRQGDAIRARDKAIEELENPQPKPDGRVPQPLRQSEPAHVPSTNILRAGQSPAHPLPRSFRHTAATLMLGAGIPLPTVSQILGHKNPTQTLNTYSHVLSGHQDEAARRIDEGPPF